MILRLAVNRFYYLFSKPGPRLISITFYTEASGRSQSPLRHQHLLHSGHIVVAVASTSEAKSIHTNLYFVCSLAIQSLNFVSAKKSANRAGHVTQNGMNGSDLQRRN